MISKRSNTLRLVYLMSLAVSLSEPVMADSGEPRASITLGGAVDMALANNRDLRAAKFAAEQARGRLMQAGRWPNPEIEFSGISDFAFASKGEEAFTVGLYQTFPLTSRLSLEKQISRVDLARALREIRNEERLLIERVQKNYIAAVAARDRAAAWWVIDRELSETMAIAERRVASGQGSVSETAFALVAQKKAWSERASAEMDESARMIVLKTLLGFDANHDLDLADSLPSILTTLREMTGRRPSSMQRPDAELLLLEMEKAELEIRLAKAEVWEGIRIGIEYVNDRGVDEPEGLDTDEFLGVKVSLPLPLWDQKQGVFEERAARRNEAAARLEAVRLTMANEITATLRHIDLLQRQTESFAKDGIAPLAEAEKALRKGFDDGRVDLRDVLVIRVQAAELRLEASQFEARLAEAYADLLSVAGTHPAVLRPYLQPHQRNP